jgi:hypothetical protein
VVDPAQPAYPFETPGAGQQYAAVQLRVTNTGTTPLNENVQADTTVLDATGHSYSAIVYDLTGCPSFLGGSISLAPGAADAGCVSFEVPTGSAIAGVRFGLGGSLATTVGEWRIP